MKFKFAFIFIFLIIGVIFSSANASALSLIVHVPEKYTDVTAGERFYFEIEVKYPENPKRKDLRMEYEIRDADGKLVAQSKALKAVETQASFIDFIVIPESADPGLHIINVKVKDYDLLSEEVSSSFQIIKEGGGGDIQIYFFILLGAVLFIGVLVVLQLKKKKKK